MTRQARRSLDAGGRSPIAGRRQVIVVAVVGLLATIALAFHFATKPGVYWAQVNLIFLAPSSTTFPNSLVVNSSSLVATAGAVQEMVIADSGAQVSSDSVTLVGEGVRNGYSVRLPNDGGQWENSFDQNLLDVQAVASTPNEALASVNRLVAQLRGALAKLQASSHVADVNLITTQLSPSAPQLYYQRGSRSRAAGATMILGLGLTVAVAVIVRRRLTRRPDRPVALI